MKSSFAITAVVLRRLACITSPLLLGALSLGCVAGSGDEKVGESADALLAWDPVAPVFSSTVNGSSTDSTNPASFSSCFFSGIRGNLNQGSDNQLGLRTRISANAIGSNGNLFLTAHSAAYTDTLNERVEAHNLVSADSVCFFGAYSATSFWDSAPAHLSISAPEKIADLSTTRVRQCYLSAIDSSMWLSDGDFARVVKKTSTDATHPTTGWYIESNLVDDPHGSGNRITASCVDLPSTTTVFPEAVVNAHLSSVAINGSLATSGTTKACALTGIYGGFDYDDFTNGVSIIRPNSQTGSWSMTVSAGKSGTAVCVD